MFYSFACSIWKKPSEFLQAHILFAVAQDEVHHRSQDISFAVTQTKSIIAARSSARTDRWRVWCGASLCSHTDQTIPNSPSCPADRCCLHPRHLHPRHGRRVPWGILRWTLGSVASVRPPPRHRRHRPHSSAKMMRGRRVKVEHWGSIS